MKRRKQILSAVLTGAMAFSSFPAAAFVNPVTVLAAANDNEGLILNKTAQLEDDGTYTINLEAYATGKVETTTTTTTTEEIVPTDIILVLDQSGSMVQNNVDGIPTGYQKATVKNSAINSGSYYYKAADGEYYKVTANKELVGKTITYKGEDGKTYQATEVSTAWTASNGTVYNTPTPFVTSSLKTYTRTKWAGNYYYKNDKDDKDTSYDIRDLSAKAARERFIKKYDDSTHTVMLMNLSDGDQGYNSSDDNKNYTAAQYIAVTPNEVNTYRYTYTYVDAKGKTVTIGTSDEGIETAVDNANAKAELYSATTSSGTRLQALQYAANEFIDGIYANAVANDVDHRVAVVGFASDAYGNSSNQYYYSNTELFVGGTQYNYGVSGKNSTYNTAGNLASNHYADAFQNANTSAGYQNLKASVNALAGHGGTHPDLGLEMANGIFGASNGTYTKADGTTADRNRIVIFMTDGEPGDTQFDNTVANNAISKAATAKNTYKATVYTVGVLNKSDANDQNTNFLKSVSSNGDYTLATGGADLSEFFQTVSSTITDTTTTTTTDVTLTKDAWLVDELSNYFTIPADFSIANNVTVSIAKHTGDHSFANPVPTTAVTAQPRTNSAGQVVGVNVSGFNFADENNWVSTRVSDKGSTVAEGNKLVVTIKGLLAKDNAATGVYIDTNADGSGIWDNGKVSDGSYVWSLVKSFNKPQTLLDKKLFVLDYAKTAALDVHNATKVDSADDKLFSKVNANSTSLLGKFGSISATSGLKYTPDTMNWTGYDSFYALGKDAAKGDHVTNNIWSKVSVLPANSVYYEDDFTTVNGKVNIEYSKDNWDVVGTSANNTETPNGDEQGWEKSLSDDAQYSDGTAHTAQTGAKASFTFTGTGVEIYSRTDLETGRVQAKLYRTDNDQFVLSKSLVIDNLSQSGTYYQIPTVAFMGLEHGKYKVELTVRDSADKARKTYYLDGIRVYNPLSEEQQEDAVVEEAYGDEINASFISVRDILLDMGSLEGNANLKGATFIDYNPEADKLEDTAYSSTIGVYNDYGPKNEVYLASGQAVAFYAGADATPHIAVGLKAPNGATTAEISNGSTKASKPINAASDLYYEVVADQAGYVVIKNTGSNLLSVTNIKMSGAFTETMTQALATTYSVDDVLTAADRFSTLSLVYDDEAIDEGTVTPGTEDTNTGDVTIENPDETPNETPVTESWISRLLGNIKKVFGK